MRIMIAEDSVLLREGLILLLEDLGVTVTAAVDEAEGLLRAVAADPPDVCVVDVRLPPTFVDEGIRAALVLRRQWPAVGVLVLSQYVEERYAVDLFIAEGSRYTGRDGRHHGGVGYLLKDRVSDVADFHTALARIAEGATVLDPEVVTQLMIRTRRADPLAALTRRENEVLRLMAEGRSNAGISAALVITERAVEKHVTGILAKLGLPAAEDDHRRVLAVLRYLDSTDGHDVTSSPGVSPGSPGISPGHSAGTGSGDSRPHPQEAPR